MKTNNTKYLDPKENKKYYSQSDGNFMTLDRSLFAHRFLTRVAWVRDWVHKLGVENHLDCGTKDGYLALELTVEGINCTALDPSKDAIEEAQMKAMISGYDVEYKVGFVEDFKTEQKFDSVSCLEVIEHVLNDEQFVENLAKLGKHVFISTPDIDGRHGLEDSKRNEEHVRLYSKEELEQLVSKFGKIVECKQEDDQLLIYFISKFI